MFGLFKSKANAKVASVVAPEVGHPLKREAAFPTTIPPLPHADYNHCTPVAVVGRSPAVTFTKDAEEDGQTTTGFLIAGVVGTPPLAIVNPLYDPWTFEIWELESNQSPRLVKQRPLKIDAEQTNWFSYAVVDGASLPGQQLMLTVNYTAPMVRSALYVYDIKTNSFRKIGRVEPDSSSGMPSRTFETWPATPDTAMVLYHTDALRLKAEVYVRRFDHLVIYSPRYLNGLEVLKLSLDDGNVRRWAMVGKTLWLDTFDRRNNASFIWSLDLSTVL
ncbi:hypothetical protein GALL_520950 [mine drainage metagenome]|uniref:Uncharacterized protein n=1 Tax=mine drainage metagenome TaxID=410659 RepID=A0A1J5P460_9ZZZZ